MEDALTETSDPATDALARRTVLKGAGLGIGAGLIPTSVPRRRKPIPHSRRRAGTSGAPEYWASEGQV